LDKPAINHDRVRCIVYHHGADTHGCPDPFCKTLGKLSDKLTLIFPHLRTLVVNGPGYMTDSEGRGSLDRIVEWVKRHEGLEGIVIYE
jgi:hypothetical protein